MTSFSETKPWSIQAEKEGAENDILVQVKLET